MKKSLAIREILKKAQKEYHYYSKRPWSIIDVGRFWDTVLSYDEINKELYTYFKRFTDSYVLAIKHLPSDDYNMLDIQSRSGNASLFWYEKRKIKSSTCVDFSDFLLSATDNKLKNKGLIYKLVKVLELPLPFDDESFNFVCCYETIEHVYEYKEFFSELVRIMSDKGLLILSTPNILWEPIHWISAIFEISHSEGPHRFLRKNYLLSLFKELNIKIIEEDATIILPFNNKLCIKIDGFLNRHLPFFIRNLIALRRIFILKK